LPRFLILSGTGRGIVLPRWGRLMTLAELSTNKHLHTELHAQVFPERRQPKERHKKAHGIKSQPKKTFCIFPFPFLLHTKHTLYSSPAVLLDISSIPVHIPCIKGIRKGSNPRNTPKMEESMKSKKNMEMK